MMPAPSFAAGGERVEAIHPEPTGYADFAARFEAAKSHGRLQMLRSLAMNAG
jgi:hypothetical protein